MIFLTPLLLFLTSCVSGTFVVNVAQTSYQAEENQNITLEWTFSTRTDTSLSNIYTHCYFYTNDRTSVLFELREGVEFPESQDPEFAGRVQWDKDVLTEGRLTLHVSRLRTSDSGFYRCDILVIPGGTNSRTCWLNVTEAKPNSTLTTEFQTNSQTPDPNQETDVKVGQPELWILVISVCIVLVMVVVGFGVAHVLIK
ncbi:butyrophilin-like protein 8 isoform X4 [Trematomus bernacchii]|uniref:butyrophilin-like protein 8 isoform X4 n=1 Tax=Trematomus bernacchii TaxID=40690 RepID=UPI00146F27E8|nr:butyrophilin-like protein 8 isoform X4 [Trematomus bernacchii]